jgi:hypothetical protein
VQPFGQVPVLEDGDLTLFGKFYRSPSVHQSNCNPKFIKKGNLEAELQSRKN